MDRLKQQSQASIRMGEYAVATEGNELRTLLGSCIGLALFDRKLQIAGLAHIVLPDSRGQTERPGKFVDTAIPTLIEQMQQCVDAKLRLSAKIAGGASMFNTTVAANIGLQNIEQCELLLKKFRIPLIATHCGGNQGRRMTLHSTTGKVIIEIVGQEPVEL